MNESNNGMALSLRNYRGKKLVSFLRNDDYAHAGEEESIIRVIHKFPKNPHRTILDVGCGLGGTAQFIQENGWGQVTGIDIEKESIEYAKKHYPTIEFYVSDVVECDKILPDKKFDLICLFNAFYAFQDQKTALIALSNIAHKLSSLVIFDYSDPMVDSINPLFRESSKTTTCFKPVKISTIKSELLSAGWVLSEIIDISHDYARWYASLLNKLSDNKEFIISAYSQAAYDKAHKAYSEIYHATINKTLGGIIIYAAKKGHVDAN